ncbi:MAG: putative baseplate assembly protein [Ilumatobacteraceae bacterium]|nr:putative baseplate assembly protein [Actinomycetota bacterium]
MTLPTPNLDDRRFQDFVDEAKRMIPSLCPEWTNHNLSDPGVALIEIFAWMSEQVLFRLNQVPERMYIDFLNLVGVRPFGASAATVPVTFWLSAPPEEAVVVPEGTEVTTEGEDGVVFATLSELRIEPATLLSAITATPEEVFADVTAELEYDRDTVTCFPSVPVRYGDAFHLGFDGSMAGQLVELGVTTAERGIGVDPEDAPIIWEAWTGEVWAPCTMVVDTTGGLNRDGVVRMVVPPAHEALTQAGLRRWWIRVRLLEPRPGQAGYGSSPTISDISVTPLGGSVLAEHANLVNAEVVGRSIGEPGQRFALANRPVLARRPGEHVVVSHDGRHRIFREVTDFSHSGPDDDHVVWDAASGVLEFGPAVRYADGSTVQHGAVPPFGAEIMVPMYRWGGGSAGNIGAGTLTTLREAVPYVDRVVNLAPATGGVDPESVDEVRQRGPASLRAGQRAVTVGDFEQLTLESSPLVARALCLPPEEHWGPVRVLVVPRCDLPPDTVSIDDFALDDDLFSTVRDHLEERRTLGSVVRVTTPYYQGVSVITRVRAATGRSTSQIRQRVLDALHQYLSPVIGGPNGTGWPFNTGLSATALAAMIGEIDGVGGIDEIALFEVDLRNDRRLGDSTEFVALDQGSLFLGRRHQVVVR